MNYDENENDNCELSEQKYMEKLQNTEDFYDRQYIKLANEEREELKELQKRFEKNELNYEEFLRLDKLKDFYKGCENE